MGSTEKFIANLIVSIVLSLATSYFNMLIWNYMVSAAFHLAQCTFEQSVAIVIALSCIRSTLTLPVLEYVGKKS